MADDADRAQEDLQRSMDAALTNIRNQMRKWPGVPRTRDCADCGEKISEARLAAVSNADRCAPCQSRRERTYA